MNRLDRQQVETAAYHPGYAGDANEPAHVATVSDRLNDALRQMDNALEMAQLIENNVFGPLGPSPVNEASGKLAQPHLRQTADLLNDRAIELTQRLNRIASAV